MLEAGAAGFRFDSQTIPAANIRSELSLMLGRLALVNRRYGEASRCLDQARIRKQPASMALRAKLLALKDKPEAATSLLEEAQELDSTDPDVAAQSIEDARSSHDWATALQTAEDAVSAIPWLDEVNSEIGKLLVPPAELWLAAAKRARAENTDSAVIMQDLDRAESTADWTDYPLLARIAELRAEQESGEAEVEWRLRAGYYWLGGDEADWALKNYEAALDLALASGLDDLSAQAIIGLADCRAYSADRKPVREVRESIIIILDKLVTVLRQRPDIATRDSWSFLVESNLRRVLALGTHGNRSDHQWRSLLASIRAVALDPVSPARWESMADGAAAMALYQVALAAANRSIVLGGEPVRLLAPIGNAGEHARALEFIRDQQAPWSDCVRGYIYAQQGQTYEAVRILSSTTIDPDWTWARQTLIAALVVTGSMDNAISHATALSEWLENRRDEVQSLAACAYCELVRGNLELSGELALRASKAVTSLDDNNAMLTLGSALLLSGKLREGATVLSEALAASRRRSLDEWDVVDSPGLRQLAKRFRVSTAALDDLSQVIERRRRELAEVEGPLQELDQSSAETADLKIVADTKALGAALLHYAAQELPAALAALDNVAIVYRAEVDSLRRHIQDLTERADREAEIQQLLELIAAEHAEAEASPLLAELLSHEEGLAALTAAAETTPPEVQAELRALLDQLLSDGELSGRAAAAIERLWPEALEPDPSNIHLLLPPSWFEGFSDPRADHPLYIRYLPEIRQRTEWQIPPINIEPDALLEPSSYRILVQDKLFAQSKVAPGEFGVSEHTLALLPPNLRDLVRHDETSDVLSVAADAVERHPLLGLLGESPYEKILEVVAKAARVPLEPPVRKPSTTVQQGLDA
jgi:hypothetical protein